MASKPFWVQDHEEGQLRMWRCPRSGQEVHYQATLVNPHRSFDQGAHAAFGQPGRDEKLPLIVWLSGLGHGGGLSTMPADLEEAASRSFVMVAPRRDPAKWWFISDAKDWGWVDGEYEEHEVARISSWIRWTSGEPGIDRNMISILGFSAGAYAATELLALGQVDIHGLVVGGVHGHGQPDLDDIAGARRLKYADSIIDKWHAYLSRLRIHGGVRRMARFVHREGDSLSKIKYAQENFNVVAYRQSELGLPEPITEEAPLDRARKREKMQGHNYRKSAFARHEVLEYLLTPGVASRSRRHASLPMHYPEVHRDDADDFESDD